MTASGAMWRALVLAEGVAGTTSPNPNVGCVIVRGGVVVGGGATRPPGQAHAEVIALAEAGDGARGATAYVTLEPCAHTGRTGPCADALIAAGIAEVHIALVDPDPNVSGKGVARLQEAGVRVTVGDGEAEATRLLEGYLKHRRTGLPFVIAKFAATLDGKIAAASGDSRWVAGEQAREWAHEFRTRVDAILCGINNVLIDDPQLTARPEGRLAAHQPLRVVADSRGRLPGTARVLSHDASTLIATTAAASGEWTQVMHRKGAEVCVLRAGEDGRVDLRELLLRLGERGVLTLLVEGGGVLHASFFGRGLVDKVHAVIAPKIIGGTAYPAIAGKGVERMQDAVTLEDVDTQRLGDDIAITGYVARD